MKIQLPIQEIRDIVELIFSQSGYNINNINLSFPHPLDIKIVRKNNDIILSFTGLLPKVTVKRFIKISAWVQGVDLGEKGGILRLKYLPDINFEYEQKESNKLFGQNNALDFSDIKKDIDLEYNDEERRILANKCLQYASEWATIASGQDLSKQNIKKLKKECKNFVIDNIKQDSEMVAGSFILSFLLLYVVLPVILKFIIEKIFHRLFN